MAAQGQQKKRGRGRPRRDGTSSENQRAEIMAAALDQFKELGYSATTMSSIARQVGLDQSSIYYWFSNKDDILSQAAAVDSSLLRVVPEVPNSPGRRPEELYAILYADMLSLCRMPFDFYLMEDVASGKPQDFADYDANFKELANRVRDVIVAGMEDGSFVECDPIFEALMVLGANEGLQHRYHTPRHGDVFPDEVLVEFKYSPFELADASASSSVGHLLAKGNVDEIREKVHELGWVELPDDGGDAGAAGSDAAGADAASGESGAADADATSGESRATDGSRGGEAAEEA